MGTYVMSDLHGCYDAYIKMLEKIKFSDDDTMYILGDVIDRGQEPIKIILDLMNRHNVICLAGNHEYMAMECFKFLLEEVTDRSIDSIDPNIIGKLLNWQQNGSVTTTDEFHKLDKETRKEVVEFISEFELYEEITVKDKDYILVHAGIDNFEPEKSMDEYEIDELIWKRPDYEEQYYSDKYVVTGHTPTMFIEGNERPGYIYKRNNNIAIDCGAGFGGRLGCLCLENGEEFYIECD